ncbi:MAG: DUF4349 domain-containing protein [Candidatus Moraniibacteriota bacterium]
MAARRPLWKKHVRIGGFLLMFVLFAPVLGIFLAKSFTLLPKRHQVPIANVGEMMPMMDDQQGMFNGLGMGKLRHNELGNAPTEMGDMSMTMVATPVSVADREIAKSASLDLRTQSLQQMVGKIQETVKNVGGYVESTNVSQPVYGVKTAWLLVRVPADRFDVTMDEAKKASSFVVSENMNAGDMTDQGIDLMARLNAKRAEENALVSLLDTATKVNDVIEVTGRLSMVRSEIEQMEAESRMLEGQVTMASITMSVTEDPQVVVDTNQMRDGNVVKQSLTDLYRWGIALGSALVAFIISGLPIVIVYGFFLWILYRFGRFVTDRIFRKK